MENRFNQEEFNQFVLKNGVVGFFEQPITLKSGRKSHWYVNWRSVFEDVFLAEKAADFVTKFILDCQAQKMLAGPVTTIIGVAEGASKLGILSQRILAHADKNFAPGSHCLAMARGSVKEHGMPKDRFFLGIPKGKTVVVEDVTTTGGSLLDALDQLKQADVEVVAAIGLTNRCQKRDDGQDVAQAVLSKAKIPYFAMSNALTLLPVAVKMANPGAAVTSSISDEFEGQLAL